MDWMGCSSGLGSAQLIWSWVLICLWSHGGGGVGMDWLGWAYLLYLVSNSILFSGRHVPRKNRRTAKSLRQRLGIGIPSFSYILLAESSRKGEALNLRAGGRSNLLMGGAAKLPV